MTTTILTDEQIESALISAGYVRADFKLTPQALANSSAIEQAVLQSPEVRAWKKDAERWRTFISNYDEHGSIGYIDGQTLHSVIDAAMEKQP